MKFSLILSALASFAIAADSVEVAAQAAGLTTLLEALDSINLTSTVVGLTNVTIFAPTNEAFQDVAAFAMRSNVNLTNDLLTKILQLHIVPGILKSTDVSVSSVSTVTALSNDSLAITANSTGGVLVSSPGNVTADVVLADLEVTQGIVHVINKVLLPDLSTITSVERNSAHGALVKGSLFFASVCILVAI